MISISQSAIPSKNAKVIRMTRRGKRFVAKNNRALQSTDSIMWQLANANNKTEWVRMEVAAGLPVPIRLQFKYFRPDRRRFDYLNAAAILCDCLVKQKYLPDDDAGTMIPVFVPFEVDARNPRVEITIIL
jgi:hypothetical protein